MIIKEQSPPSYGSPGPLHPPRADEPSGREPGYVYYRVYAPDGAIPSKTAPNADSPFLGRIRAKSVPPPLNVASLKRTLAHAEGMPDTLGFRTALYRSPLDPGPMEELEKVAHSLLGTGTPFDAANALTLVFVDELTDQERASIPVTDKVPLDQGNTQHVYYRLHTRSGDDGSATAFDPDDSASGRVDIALITPPRDAQAVRRCIARVEGRPIYAFADLYANVADEEPLPDNAMVLFSFDGSNYRAGASPAEALRVVQPERRPGLYNRPLKVLTAQHYIRPPFQFTHLLSPQSGPDLEWLQVDAGDILYTDGVIHHSWKPRGVNYHLTAAQPVYTAITLRGFSGMVLPENVKFLDE
ncbi:hypothetical protein C8R46DRAFT_1056649 [Mycena filopes]|nr:hypothetical protein C8R46DRAFT_1056649 [Mycena filopes]